jgi:hypothetical protein
MSIFFSCCPGIPLRIEEFHTVVILLPCFRIREHPVGLVDPFDLFLVVLAEIGVVLLYQSDVALFDFVLGGVGIDGENGVVC